MAEGSSAQISGITKEKVADFVHGSEGFGNTYQKLVEVCFLGDVLLRRQSAQGCPISLTSVLRS